MNSNNLRLAFRRLLREKTLTFINITGLAIGMTCTIVIMLWVKSEVTYDSFHKNPELIYRVELNEFQEGALEERSTITQMPLGPAIAESFPEIQSFVRLRGPMDFNFNIEEKNIRIDNVYYADSGFFDVFSFELLDGNPRTALAEPNTIVLTSEAAKSIFGDTDPVGKTLLYNGSIPLMVTGIIAPAPDNSHIKYEALISFQSMYPFTHCMDWDCNYSFFTYIRVNPGTDIDNLTSKFPDFLWEPLNKKMATANFRQDIALRPVEDIHLYSKSYELERPGSLQMIYLFSAISVFIIIIACINFINLTTAQVSKRGIEIGIKKVSGASRNQLAGQIFGEITIQAVLALVIAVILVELTLPSFNALLNKSLSLSIYDFTLIGGLVILLALSVMISGTYPAFVLTKLNPALVMKKGQSKHGIMSNFRNFLVILQFVISVSLIAGTAIVYDQLKYIHSMDLGFNQENVINIPLENEEARNVYETLLLEFRNLPEVISAGASTEVPGHGFTSNGYIPEGMSNPIMIHSLDIDETYLETMDIHLVEGRNFSKEIASDKDAFIVNETLVKTVGWEEPLGKIIERNGKKHPVIGVVKDFHFTSAHEEITPLVITKRPWEGIQSYGNISIRIQSTDLPQTLFKIENIWKSRVSTLPFEYQFLDERFAQLYQSEQRLGLLFIYFTGLAILISGLGVFGLILFMVEQKTKEIGIRKILGASITQLVSIFSVVFTKRILIAIILAIPITLWTMNAWLQNFAYKTSVKPLHFAIAGGLALVIALSTISIHAVKAALRNPSETLKYE